MVEHYITDGEYEVTLTDTEYSDYIKLPKEHRIEYLRSCGNLIKTRTNVENNESTKA